MGNEKISRVNTVVISRNKRKTSKRRVKTKKHTGGLVEQIGVSEYTLLTGDKKSRQRMESTTGTAARKKAKGEVNGNEGGTSANFHVGGKEGERKDVKTEKAEKCAKKTIPENNGNQGRGNLVPKGGGNKKEWGKKMLKISTKAKGKRGRPR